MNSSRKSNTECTYDARDRNKRTWSYELQGFRRVHYHLLGRLGLFRKRACPDKDLSILAEKHNYLLIEMVLTTDNSKLYESKLIADH